MSHFFSIKSRYAVRGVIAFLALTTTAFAGQVFNNGTPNDFDSYGITASRTADDFTLSSATTIASVRFYWGPTTGRPLSDFSGTITYAIYNNNAGSIGALIASATVTASASTPTGGFRSTCGGAPNCPNYAVTFNLATPLNLAAGTYWLELHEGGSLTSNDGTTTYWATAAGAGNARQCTLCLGLPSTTYNVNLAFQLFDTASNPVTWYLNQVKFEDGGTASGSFVFDAPAGEYSNLNMTTTTGSIRTGASYAILITGLLQDASNLVAATGSPTANYTGRSALGFSFASPLTAAGGTIAIQPYNYPVSLSVENACTDAQCLNVSPPIRKITSGWVSTTDCTYSILPIALVNAPAGGGNGIVNVTTQAGCPWTAASNAGFATITSGASGTGSGTVNYSLQANPTVTSRSGSLTVASQTFNITQLGISCSYSLSPTNNIVPSGAGSTGTTVTAPAGCAWTATSNAAWITITSGSNGNGNGAVQFNFQANTGPSQRTGTLTIGGQTFTLNQNGISCTYTVSPTSMVSPAAGTTGSSTVTAPAGCTWTAVSNDAWITITSGSSGTGNGTVNFQVAANLEPTQRIGSATVAGQTVTFSQNAQSCTYQVTNTNMTPSANGDSGSSTITTQAGCQWNAQSNVPWVTVLPTSGTGNGTVNYTVQANNSGSQRTGTATVAGQTVNFTQAAQQGNCTFTLSQTSITVPAAGGTGSTNVNNTGGSNCNWTVINPASWIIITAGAGGGTGNGTVSFTALVNSSSSQRVATLTIAGQSLTVTQPGSNGGGPGPTTSGLKFVPITPCRLVDTRTAYAAPRTGAFGPPLLNAGSTRSIPIPSSITCSVPATAKAYVFNVTLDTIENGTGPVDFVTVYPTGEARPDFWTARTTTGGYIANAAIVKAGTGGSVDVYTSNNVNFILDINGYFTDDANTPGLLYYPIQPCRAVDTRGPTYSSLPAPYGNSRLQAGETRTLRLPGSPACQIPVASAYSTQLTLAPGELTNGNPVAFLTAWPAGVGRPNISNMNAFFGYAVANSGIIPASSNGSINVFALDATNLIIDVNGYFAPDDGTGRGLLYFPTTQCKVMNTQDGSLSNPFGGPAMTGGVDRTVPVPSGRCSGLPATAKAWAANATVVPNGNGMPFLSMWPSGTAWPNISQLNAFQGQTVSNSGIVPASSTGSIDVRVAGNTQVAIDIAGYFGVGTTTSSCNSTSVQAASSTATAAGDWSAGGSISINVNASQTVSLANDDAYSTDANGFIRVAPTPGTGAYGFFTGQAPAGVVPTVGTRKYPQPDFGAASTSAPFGALLYGWSPLNSGTPPTTWQLAGTSLTTSVPGSGGRLYLLVNDGAGGFDNSGAFNANVCRVNP